MLNPSVEMGKRGVGPPVDKYNFSYFTFFMFGFAALLPWNAALNTFDYF